MGMGFPFFSLIVASGMVLQQAYFRFNFGGQSRFFFLTLQEVSLVGEVLGEAKELNQGKVCKSYSMKSGQGCRALDGRKRKGTGDVDVPGMSVLDYF